VSEKKIERHVIWIERSEIMRKLEYAIGGKVDGTTSVFDVLLEV
jgi:hypothetical protein